MGIVSAKQTGQDGVGEVKTLTGLTSARLKAKEVSTIRNGTLKITGDRSAAATWTIEVVVSPGTAVTEHYPPAVVLDPPPPNAPTPTANFTWGITQRNS